MQAAEDTPPPSPGTAPPPTSGAAPSVDQARLAFLRERLHAAKGAALATRKGSGPVESSVRKPSSPALHRPHRFTSPRVSRAGNTIASRTSGGAPAQILVEASLPPPKRQRDLSQAVVTAACPKAVKAPRPKAVELCAGSAGLTRALIRRGFDAYGVDWVRNRHTTIAPVVRFDLTDVKGQASIRRLLLEERPAYAHAAPPCGTMSRARDKPIPLALRRLGAPCPPPLRSNRFPEGLPSLSGLDLQKVTLANTLADFVGEVMEEFMVWGVSLP